MWRMKREVCGGGRRGAVSDSNVWEHPAIFHHFLFFHLFFVIFFFGKLLIRMFCHIKSPKGSHHFLSSRILGSQRTKQNYEKCVVLINVFFVVCFGSLCFLHVSGTVFVGCFFLWSVITNFFSHHVLKKKN